MHASTYFALQAVAILGTLSTLFAKNVILPIPGGPLQLGTATAILTDHSRPNWKNDTSPRALPISVFYPVGYAPCYGGYLSEYVPQVVSDFENNYFELDGVLANINYAAFKSQMYHTCSGGKHRNGYPLLIFSPGYERTRLLYGALAQAVAKAGYVVVTIDHPYDADIIQYPDGKIITTDTNVTDAEFVEIVAVRVEDVSFILNQLSDKKIARKLVPYDIDTSEVGMYGHSVGGAAAANALISEPRLVGGLNFDGQLFEPVTLVSNDKPFLQFGQEGHTHFSDVSLNQTWPLLRAWHEELSFNGTTHSTFGDLALLVHVSGLGNSGNESQVVSHLNGLRVTEVIQVVVTDFFKFLFTGKESKLLKCDNEGYPEITCATTCTPGITC
ncbi:hypothetical protein V500_08653 [Pseudogymnoascus sp. VKM F-4518 (FW-2643)]|nr:hypothetical protein V500_08653 [Pseudogymnoascus sp. VKM F-4518 (FW-2643)]